MHKFITLYSDVIDRVLVESKKNNVLVRFDFSEQTKICDELYGSSGYFESESKCLSIAIDEKFTAEEILETFIHESCHMDQWSGDKFLWDMCQTGYDYFLKWLEKKVELQPHEINECIQNIIRLEQDCEQRSCTKIAKWNLPLNYDDYSKKSASYILSYYEMGKRRQWLRGSQKIEVYSKAPLINNIDLTKGVPVLLQQMFDEHLYAPTIINN